MEQFSREIYNHVAVISVNLMRATLNEANDFKEYLDDVILLTKNDIIVDISNCTHIDSTFLGALVMGLKKLSKNGKDLLLVEPSGAGREILSITSMGKLFRLFSSREEAMEFVSSTVPGGEELTAEIDEETIEIKDETPVIDETEQLEPAEEQIDELPQEEVTIEDESSFLSEDVLPEEENSLAEEDFPVEENNELLNEEIELEEVEEPFFEENLEEKPAEENLSVHRNIEDENISDEIIEPVEEEVYETELTADLKEEENIMQENNLMNKESESIENEKEQEKPAEKKYDENDYRNGTIEWAFGFSE